MICSVCLLIISAALRLTTYERYLPFQDYTDESAYQVTALNRRGVEENSFVDWRYAALPPAYVWFTMFAQQTVDTGRPWTLLEDYLHFQRLVAVLAGVLTTAVVIRIGWQIGRIIAAWFAGLVWAVTPLIVDFNSLAIPDPFVYLTIALAIAMLIKAWYSDNPLWLTAALLAGIIAIYLKYNPVYILIPWGLVALVMLRRNPRKMAPWIALQLIVGIMTAWYLIISYGALDIPAREVQTFRGEGLAMALTPWRNFNNWWSAIRPIGEALFLVTLGLAVIAYVYSRRRGWHRVHLHWYGIFALYVLGGLLMLSSFTNVWEGHITSKIRHVLPITIVLLGLWSGAVAQIIWTLDNWNKERDRSFSLRWLPVLSVIGLSVAIALPALAGDYALIQQYQKLDTRQVLWEWTNDNIEPEGRILSRDGDSQSRTWNRWWGGYDGSTVFDWWHEPTIPQNSPAEYVERGIYYFVITDHDLQTGYGGQDTEVQSFTDQIIHVKTIDTNVAGRTGDTIHFYRMVPPEVELDIVFDDRIVLAGYDLSGRSVMPGSTLHFRPYWQIRDYPQSNYSMFVHLYPQDEDRVIAQTDGPPSTLHRPTLTWDDLDELYIGSDVTLEIPSDLAPGTYRLVIGLYDFVTGVRLRTATGGEYYTLLLTVSS